MSLPFTATSLTGLGGGSGSFTYALVGAPPGIFVTSAGVVTGTPSVAGTFNFAATVTDSAGNTVTATGCSITVTPAPTVSCPVILGGTLTVPYNQPIPFTVGAGNSLVSITLSSGGLPAGLSINAATNSIMGTPASIGQSSFVLAILDNRGGVSLSATCTITVQAAGCLSTGPATCLTHATVADSTCSTCPQCCRSPNPCFAKQCQLNAVLLLDNSNSMTDALTPGVRTAVNGFLQGLLNIVSVGGTASLGVVMFGTNATVEFQMQPISATYVNTLVTWVNTVYLSSCCKGNTNWADALKLGATTAWTNPVDIFIMYTDGKPESVSFQPGCANDCFNETNAFFSDLCSPAGSCPGQTTPGLQFAQTFNFNAQGLWAACPQADAIKKAGSKIFLVGVGDVLPNEDEIQVITGVRSWDGKSSTFFTSDYIIAQSYSALYGLFSAVVQGLCPCLSSSAPCAPVGLSCNAALFSSRVVITTRQTPSVTFPQYSVIYATMHYLFTNGANARLAYEFFPPGTPITAASVTPMRTDIINPCQLQRQVQCSAGCFVTQNNIPMPRFFYESTDTPGTASAVHHLPIAGCTGFTKVAAPGNAEAIAFIWVLSSDLVTPCAAEDASGTFYQFYQQDGATPGVYELGVQSSFNFSPAPPAGGCTAVTCTQAVDMVFVVDEQTTVPSADIAVYKQFVNQIIALQALQATPPARFAVAWTCTPGFTQVAPFQLQSTQPDPNGFVQNIQVTAHTQSVCTAPDFAAIITNVVNTLWSTPSANPRRLVTIVGGPDGGTASNRFTTMNTLLDSLGVQRWAYGVGQGSSDSALLQNLGQGSNYAHFVSVPNSILLPQSSTTQGLLACPPANLCGSTCLGMCACINTCTCTAGCTQDQCSLTRTCDAVTKGCSGVAKDCNTNNLCIPYGCDPVTGCTTSPIVCNDANACTVDSCDTSTGRCFYTPVNCDDHNLCTTDVCPSNYNPPTVPCQHLPYSGPGTCTPGNVCPDASVCDDLNACTADSCDAFNNCIYAPVPAPPAPSLCSVASCNPATGAFTFSNKVCNDNNACTKDNCDPATGNCVYTPLNYYNDVWLPANPPPATFCKCTTYTCVAPAGTWATAPVVCTTSDSCLTISCDCTLGCTTANKTCPTRTDVSYGACEYPIGCIGTGAQPQCVYQNITSLFDFCGQCNGDNVACFFSSVFPVSSIATISGGVAAAIVIACVVAVALAIWLSKKGYDYYKAQSDLSSAGMTVNPTFQQNELAGTMHGL